MRSANPREAGTAGIDSVGYPANTPRCRIAEKRCGRQPARKGVELGDALFSLADKRVLVVGGTRGIGRAISAHFARSGAGVIANYARNDDAARALQAELPRLELCRADVTTQEGKQRLVEAAGSGPLHGFVFAAATGVHRPIDELTLRHWNLTFALNVRAFFDLVKALRPVLASGSGVVALSSEGAVHAFPGYTLVGVSKGALEALCGHLALVTDDSNY